MIYLVRHGLTEWNEKNIFRGQKDIPLSSEGRFQAELAGRYLKNKNIQKIHTSPLKRAYETSLIISEQAGCEVLVIDGLTDIHFGDWEGKSVDWVKETFPKKYNLYKRHPGKVRFPNGESLETCRKRAFNAFCTIVSGWEKNTTASGAHFVVVSHRVIIKLLLLAALGLPTASFWRIRIDTCGINELDYVNNCFIINRINSTPHLANNKYLMPDF
jgi:broad specificity phosphatase PhoE